MDQTINIHCVGLYYQVIGAVTSRPPVQRSSQRHQQSPSVTSNSGFCPIYTISNVQSPRNLPYKRRVSPARSRESLASVDPVPQNQGPLFKSELCRAYEEGGHCRYADRCQFAHGVHELRQVARHPKYKTELCRTFHTTGLCPYGSRCHFVHNADETAMKRSTTIKSLPETPRLVLPRYRQTSSSSGSCSSYGVDQLEYDLERLLLQRFDHMDDRAASAGIPSEYRLTSQSINKVDQPDEISVFLDVQSSLTSSPAGSVTSDVWGKLGMSADALALLGSTIDSPPSSHTPSPSRSPLAFIGDGPHRCW